jgi:hypothetical protein
MLWPIYKSVRNRNIVGCSINNEHDSEYLYLLDSISTKKQRSRNILKSMKVIPYLGKERTSTIHPSAPLIIIINIGINEPYFTYKLSIPCYTRVPVTGSRGPWSCKTSRLPPFFRQSSHRFPLKL